MSRGDPLLAPRSQSCRGSREHRVGRGGNRSTCRMEMCKTPHGHRQHSPFPSPSGRGTGGAGPLGAGCQASVNEQVPASGQRAALVGTPGGLGSWSPWCCLHKQSRRPRRAQFGGTYDTVNPIKASVSYATGTAAYFKGAALMSHVASDSERPRVDDRMRPSKGTRAHIHVTAARENGPQEPEPGVRPRC